MNNYIFTVLLACVFVFAPSQSFAKFSITPGVEVKGEYNDNINLDETGEEDDIITTFRPGIKLEYAPNTSLDLKLDYGFDYRHYSSHSNLSEESHRLMLNARVRPLKRVLIDVTDTYTKLPVDIRNKYAADNTVTNMTDSNSLTVSTSVLLPLSSSVSTTAGYTYNDLWYEDEGSTDSETHSAFLGLTNRFSSKLSGELRYNFSAYRPDLSGQSAVIVEYDRHDGSVAVTYQISSGFGVNGVLGESWVDYETRDNSRMTFWSAGADYALAALPSTKIEISYSRYLSDSSTSGAYRNRRGDLVLRTGKRLKIKLNPYIADNKYVNADRQDKIKGVGFDVSRPLAAKVDARLDGSWEDQEFLPEQEEVRRYNLGCSLDYKLSSKVTAAVGYRYNVRNSNVDNEDFTNNIGWLQAKVSF